MDYLARITALQSHLPDHSCFLFSRPADILYFTGFVCLNPEEREAFLVVTQKTAILLYPSFSPVAQVNGITYHPGYWPEDLHEVLQKYSAHGIKHCLIDGSSLYVSEYRVIEKAGLEFKEMDRSVLWHLRSIKDEDEIKKLKTAGTITAQVMDQVLNNLTVGVTEQSVATNIDIAMRTHGAQGCSFPPVVAFGEHSALPHHQPTTTKLTQNKPVLIDIGAKFDGYCGDMTRTVWFGKNPSKKFVKVEQLIHTAYTAALTETTADTAVAVIDKAARKTIETAGYGKTFIHTTGHGVGLEIHEQPSLYYKKDDRLSAGSVITIEPGVYFPGEFGYRHENMVLVTTTRAQELT